MSAAQRGLTTPEVSQNPDLAVSTFCQALLICQPSTCGFCLHQPYKPYGVDPVPPMARTLVVPLTALFFFEEDGQISRVPPMKTDNQIILELRRQHAQASRDILRLHHYHPHATQRSAQRAASNRVLIRILDQIASST